MTEKAEHFSGRSAGVCKKVRQEKRGKVNQKIPMQKKMVKI